MKTHSSELDKEFRKTLMSMYVFMYLAVYSYCGVAQFQLYGNFPDIMSYTYDMICHTDKTFADKLNIFSEKIHLQAKADNFQENAEVLAEKTENN